MNKNYYVTTPIYYVNASPHIGHAYTNIVADTIARYKRLSGFDVCFLTGTDEHGLKIEKAAKAKNMSPQKFTDEVSEVFKKLTEDLAISNTDFIRTTEVRHKKSAKFLWETLFKNGHIYKDKYEGWYAVRDECFYSESEIVDGKAPTGAEVEWVEEESYFFDLSQWQEPLLNFYAANEDFIYPKSRMNEVINFVKSGLKDLSISRCSFAWGIDITGDDKHIMYVWLDALTNYLSGVNYPDTQSANFKKYWPCNLHVIGKDILRFHAVYWPAFLMAANLPLPKNILAHGWWVKSGKKISKSEGNVIDPQEIIAEYGLDQFRYFVLRETSFGKDGDYNKEAITTRVNSELANKIGNLLQRSASMLYKNNDSQIPDIDLAVYESEQLLKEAQSSVDSFIVLMDKYELSNAMQVIVNLAEKANIFVDEKEPWVLKNTNINEMKQVLYIVMEVCRYLGIMLQPFIPNSASKLLDTINVDKNERNFKHLTKEFRLTKREINKPEPIFPRIINEESKC